MCNKIPDKEWSAVLFYTLVGGIDDPDSIQIELKDLYLLDIGTQAATTYSESNDPEYIDFLMNADPSWIRGTIHSHNNMDVFFSTTDINDLEVNAYSTDMYLSVIVNNKLNYEAKIVYSGELTGNFKGNKKLTINWGSKVGLVYNCTVEREHTINSVLTNKYKTLCEKNRVVAQKKSKFSKTYTPYKNMSLFFDDVNEDRHDNIIMFIHDIIGDECYKPGINHLLEDADIEEAAITHFGKTIDELSIHTLKEIRSTINQLYDSRTLVKYEKELRKCKTNI